jgi:predicted deacylase
MKVTTDLGGGDVSIPAHVISGPEKGRTLTVLSLVHGNEWWTHEVVRRLVQRTQSSALAGTLIVIPVANPVAFNYLRRYTVDETDSTDLNRVFPGHFNSITEQLASKLATEIFANSDCVIDFHMGKWGNFLGDVSYGMDFPNAETVKESDALARAFGYPCIRRFKVASFPGPKSIIGYLGLVLGKPSLAVEIGCAGFEEALEEKWINTNLTGIENVMKHLKMLKGVPKLPEKYLIWEKRWRIEPHFAGIIDPKVPSDSAMREVEKDDLLGEVLSPYSFDVIEELKAPGKGIIYYYARRQPCRPGSGGFGVVDLNDKNTKWISAT